ncbi:MAG: HEAT repeat domain-containing protein [Planctomycetota bacterium]|jgi:hypothetical protein
MLRNMLSIAVCYVIALCVGGCASGRVSKLVKNLREDPIRSDGAPSETMKSLAEYEAKAIIPIIDALTVDEREYNISLVRTLVLIGDAVEPEKYAELLSHPGRGVAETAEVIILDPKTRNLTDKLSSMIRKHDPKNAAEPRHAEPIFQRILHCLGETGHPPAIPILVNVLKQPDGRTRAKILLAMARIFERWPYKVVARKYVLYKRYYQANIYIILRTIMKSDTDAEVRHYASRAMESFTEIGCGLFAITAEERDVEREKAIILRYDNWALTWWELAKYPNCPDRNHLARRLGWQVMHGRIVPKNTKGPPK